MKRNVSVLAALAAALAFAGCATTKQEVKAAPAPALVSQNLSIDQDLTTFHLAFEGQIKSEVPATIEKAKWEMVVEGKVVKSGEEALNVDIPAGGTSPFEFTVSSQYVNSPEELKAASEKGGALLAALRGTLFVKQGATTAEVPFARSRDVRTPRLPTVKMQEIDGARYSAEEANILFYLGVVNPNPFPLKVGELQYTVLIDGKKVGEGTRARGDAINPAATGVFEVQVSVSKDTIGPEVKDLIKSLNLPYSVTGELKGDLFTIPYKLDGAVKLNVSK